jgi:hypothetical protein
MAQRQRRDWRDATTIIAYSGKMRLRGAAEPLSAGIYPDGGPSFTPQETAGKSCFLAAGVSPLFTYLG